MGPLSQGGTFLRGAPLYALPFLMEYRVVRLHNVVQQHLRALKDMGHHFSPQNSLASRHHVTGMDTFFCPICVCIMRCIREQHSAVT